MTSTTDTAGHPDVAEISDLTEGLLPPSRTADVRRHLDNCALCADVHASLEEIRGLLGTLPGPPRMPDDVAGRIDAALAAEALLSATAPDREAAAEDDRASVSRETSTVGVSVEEADSGPSSSVDRPSGHPRAATGPGRAHRVRRGRRRAAVLGTAFAAAAVGLGAVLLQSLGNDGSGNTHGTTTQHSGSQVTFSDAQLKSQVSDLLAAGKSTSHRSGSAKPWGIESDSAGSKSKEPNTLNAPAVRIPDCIQQGTGRSDAVLAAEKGTYKGKSVYLVVLSDPSDGTKVVAYVVDDACTKQTSPSPGTVLVKQSYARP